VDREHPDRRHAAAPRRRLAHARAAAARRRGCVLVHGSREPIDAAAAKAQFGTPYVVPNPYVEAASFEPARFNVSGRGDRRMEFRGLPAGATVRIYSLRGELVQTLHHDGSQGGFVAWNLRTKDNLDVAPGLFVFQVDAPGVGTSLGKFAIVK
jgi:hypothetical protein